jgi:hypothetical protein
MSNIIRCRHCRTFVYDHASRCHGCGTPVRGGRLLGRGSYVFVILATAAFGLARGVDLIQEREWAAAQRARETAADARARNFLQAYFRGDDAVVLQWVGPADAELATDLRKLRESLPAVFPANGAIEFGRDREANINVETHRSSDGSLEAVVAKPPVFGDRSSVYWGKRRAGFPLPYEESDGPEASSPTNSWDPSRLRRPIVLVSKSKGSWYHTSTYHEQRGTKLIQFNSKACSESSREYEVFVTRDDRRFRILVGITMSGGDLRTLRIDRVEDVGTGEVILPADS